MKSNIRIMAFILSIIILFSSLNFTFLAQSSNNLDLDPLVDLTVTVKILKIRSLEKLDYKTHEVEWIDFFTKPDFYVKVFINDREFKSPVWKNTRYVNDPQWSATLNVPDEEEFVNIKIQLWDSNRGLDKLCDISRDYYDGYKETFDVEIFYSLKSGHWYGDDFISGYGRLNGCDDNSIYERGKDCELWFDVYQNDYDGDTIPYWTEVNVFGTDPEYDNTGEDIDGDGVPIEWEYKWGHYFWWDWGEEQAKDDWIYDPFTWEDHANFDLDVDGLDNIEEYLTSQWGSDPFRKDLFVQLDQMEASPDGQESILPEGAKELLRTAYDRQNIVYHLDDGCMGGSNMIPFDNLTDRDELMSIYWNYFLNGDINNWRRGVFHYGLVAYDAGYAGYVFWGGVGPYLDSFQISSSRVERKVVPKWQWRRDLAYASVYMHETGHTLGIFSGNTPGCDDSESMLPWQKNFWKWGPYESCMNYRYTYRLVDYSDGSNGKNDFDDWDFIDLTFFQRQAF